MAKQSKKDALGSALGALIAPSDPLAVSPGSERPQAAKRSDLSAETDEAAEGYARTSTGYRRDSGDVVRRLSLFLTERERRDLRRLAVDAGAENVTAYVVEALGLGRATPGPRP